MEPRPPRPLTRDEHVYMAKLAEQAERYAEMVEHMRHAVNLSTAGSPLSHSAERNSLRTAAVTGTGAPVVNWGCATTGH